MSLCKMLAECRKFKAHNKLYKMTIIWLSSSSVPHTTDFKTFLRSLFPYSIIRNTSSNLESFSKFNLIIYCSFLMLFFSYVYFQTDLLQFKPGTIISCNFVIKMFSRMEVICLNIEISLKTLLANFSSQKTSWISFMA